MSVRLLNLDQASEFLKKETGVEALTTKWVRRQIDSGRLGCTVISRRRHVREDKLRTLISRWIKDAE